MTVGWKPPTWAAPTPQAQALAKLAAQQKATAAERRWQREVDFSGAERALDGQIRALLADREAGLIVGEFYSIAPSIC